MLCFKFHQNHTINEEFDFWGVKEVVLGVAKVGRTWEHVPKHHRRLFLPKQKPLYAIWSSWRYILHQARWTILGEAALATASTWYWVYISMRIQITFKWLDISKLPGLFRENITVYFHNTLNRGIINLNDSPHNTSNRNRNNEYVDKNISYIGNYWLKFQSSILFFCKVASIWFTFLEWITLCIGSDFI